MLFVLTFLAAAMEGLSIAILIPLFSILDPESTSEAPIVRLLEEALSMIGADLTLSSIGFLFFIFLGLSCGIFILQAQMATSLQAAYSAQWQRRLVRALTGADWLYLRALPLGNFSSVVSTDAPKTGSLFYQINVIITSGIFILTQSLVALIISPEITISICTLAGLLFLATHFLTGRAKRDGQTLTEANAQLLGAISEISNALKFVKATATEATARDKIEPAIGRIQSAAATSAFDVQLTKAIFDYGGGAVVATLLLAGPSLFDMDIAAIIVVVAMFVRLFPRVTAFRQCYQSISVVLPSLERCSLIEASARSASNFAPSKAASGAKAHTRNRSTMIELSEKDPANVTLDNVTVHAPGGTQILNELNLKIQPGDWLAIVGPSGAGKTTIIDLVLGLVEASKGKVSNNNTPLNNDNVIDWRKQIGYIGQEPVIFSGSIFENLFWGQNQKYSNEEEAISALRTAAALDIRGGDIHKDDLGGLGSSLSGGERQRIALARALAKNPTLLVLDEATSALDPQTEQQIISSITALRGKVTVIMTAHRLWSVRNATQIIVLEKGTIIQCGSFDELIKQNGWFSEMVKKQS